MKYQLDLLRNKVSFMHKSFLSEAGEMSFAYRIVFPFLTRNEDYLKHVRKAQMEDMYPSIWCSPFFHVVLSFLKSSVLFCFVFSITGNELTAWCRLGGCSFTELHLQNLFLHLNDGYIPSYMVDPWTCKKPNHCFWIELFALHPSDFYMHSSSPVLHLKEVWIS